jgi:hypothetical protein
MRVVRAVLFGILVPAPGPELWNFLDTNALGLKLLQHDGLRHSSTHVLDKQAYAPVLGKRAGVEKHPCSRPGILVL